MFGLPSFPQPHGECYLWYWPFIWTDAAANVVIGCSYLFIGFKCYQVYRDRRMIMWADAFTYKWIPRMFGAFIVLCGLTHFMATENLFRADFYLALVVDVATATVSLYTAAGLDWISKKRMHSTLGSKEQKAAS